MTPTCRRKKLLKKYIKRKHLSNIFFSDPILTLVLLNLPNNKNGSFLKTKLDLLTNKLHTLLVSIKYLMKFLLMLLITIKEIKKWIKLELISIKKKVVLLSSIMEKEFLLLFIKNTKYMYLSLYLVTSLLVATTMMTRKELLVGEMDMVQNWPMSFQISLFSNVEIHKIKRSSKWLGRITWKCMIKDKLHHILVRTMFQSLFIRVLNCLIWQTDSMKILLL